MSSIRSLLSITEVNAEKKAKFFDKLAEAFRLVRTEEHMEIIEEVIALYNFKEQAIKKLPGIQRIFEMVSEYWSFWSMKEEAMNSSATADAPELDRAREKLVNLLHDEY
ncbi:hypothetical protein N7510_008478 [Penicillium lagena]|uniref:uncharacterized protein n=1 Tax=Penicillium lagena TaxID=94218 RepID=UPI00253F665D|nr:uncharacterized protein N7510_008478 [Penicillium lagena]KAJ5605697.1 hypothetical protein N7510_008478 [Penicillium lagena]